MIIVMKSNAKDDEIKNVIDTIEKLGFKSHLSKGEETTIIGVIGDERRIDASRFQLLAGVERVMPILKPYKLASRDFRKTDTIIKLNGTEIGGTSFCVMAGPCAVESYEQTLSVAKRVKAAGASVLRGGAFKPRTSPYSFQGLGKEGLQILAIAKKETGLSIVTEVMAEEDIPMVAEIADILQVGARNMQNFSLLDELGRQKKPVLLKRGMMSTVEELLLSAEYLLTRGNSNIILCERGIRTFEKSTRNTLDISVIPVTKKFSHLPIIIDPSHAGGVSDYVVPLALAGAAVGADGLIIEVHNQPENALCDGQQSITPEKFTELMSKVKEIVRVVGKRIN